MEFVTSVLLLEEIEAYTSVPSSASAHKPSTLVIPTNSYVDSFQINK